MGRQAPIGSTPVPGELPAGNWKLRIEELTERPWDDGTLAYSLACTTVEPIANLPYYQTFTVGSRPTDWNPDAADDPDAQDPETWVKSRDFQRLKGIAQSVGCSEAAKEVCDMDVLAGELAQNEFDAKVTHSLNKAGDKTYVRIAYSYKAGTLAGKYGMSSEEPRKPRVPGAAGVRPAVVGGRPMAPATRPTPTAPPARSPQPPVQRTIARPPVRQAAVATPPPNGADTTDDYEVPEEAPPPAASKRPGA